MQSGMTKSVINQPPLRPSKSPSRVRRTGLDGVLLNFPDLFLNTRQRKCRSGDSALPGELPNCQP